MPPRPENAERVKPEHIIEEARSDWDAARESRVGLAKRKTEDYRLYRLFRADVGAHGYERATAGPFGWSKLDIPLIYWIVETIIPRLAVGHPTFQVDALTPAAAPFAQAKELRMQHLAESMDMTSELVRALKSMILFGDGPWKVSWDPQRHLPRFSALRWFDWFLSPEARRINDAEVIWNRVWVTKRQLEKMARKTDRNGKPLWQNLDQVFQSGVNVDIGDDQFDELRTASGWKDPRWNRDGPPVMMLEGWYHDGTLVVLGGHDASVLCQIRTSPLLDELGRPVRPFGSFQNTPDPESPYAIGEAEMLEAHQSETGTIRNQAIDQMTVAINSPVVYDRAAGVTKAQIDAAFGAPGGSLGVDGDVDRAVKRVAPGSVDGNWLALYQNSRDEAQFVSGVNDNVAGQTGEGAQTATETQIINREANKRWQFKVLTVEGEVGRVGRVVDLYDRRYGNPREAIRPAESFQGVRDGQQGILDLGGNPIQPQRDQPPGAAPPGFVRTDAELHTFGARYQIKVKGGSLTPPSEDEMVQRLGGFMAFMSAAPQLAQQLNWRELGELATIAWGFDPARVLLSQEEIIVEQLTKAIEAGAAGSGEPQAQIPAQTGG